MTHPVFSTSAAQISIWRRKSKRICQTAMQPL